MKKIEFKLFEEGVQIGTMVLNDEQTEVFHNGMLFTLKMGGYDGRHLTIFQIQAEEPPIVMNDKMGFSYNTYTAHDAFNNLVYAGHYHVVAAAKAGKRGNIFTWQSGKVIKEEHIEDIDVNGKPVITFVNIE